MFWNIFKSVKLAVFLLIILAIIAIIGTIIPQGEESIRFAMKLRPETFRIFSMLGLFDVYHTLWFRAILGLLTLNLIVCSIDRFPKTLKRIKAQPPVDMKRPFQDIDEDNVLRIKGKMELITDSIRRFLQKKGKGIRSKITDREAFFYFEEGVYSHFGVYIVHLSIIMILLGGIIGSIWGFEGYMNILEGEKNNVIRLTRRSKPLKLNFWVRCDKFLVKYYKNGMPKEYMSRLTFITGKKEIKKELRVNHPVRFHGITFYQASYGTSVEDRVYLKIINNESKKSYIAELRVGQSYKIPDSNVMIKVLDIREDFARTGPAVLLSIRRPEQGKEKRLVLLKNIQIAKKRLPAPMLNSPMFNSSIMKPYTFVIEQIPTRYYTGLQVSRDPGVPIVWTGFFMLIMGLMITFFLSHRRIWVRITKKNGEVEVAVSGMSNRDPVSLQKRIRSILNSIKEEVIQDV